VEHQPLHVLADEELMRLVARGRADAFELIYDRHVSAVFGLAYRICGARGAAEEATQEAFLSIWREGRRYRRERASVRSWLLGIVHNRAIDSIRSHTVHARRQAPGARAGEQLVASERTDVDVARREEAALVQAALSELPPEQRQVLDLAYFGGFTHAEIADMLEMPLGTVKGRTRLGLEKLRVNLERQGVAP
jgi:RNA polymerase sigma-70 factor (ECF subfamily)